MRSPIAAALAACSISLALGVAGGGDLASAAEGGWAVQQSRQVSGAASPQARPGGGGKHRKCRRWPRGSGSQPGGGPREKACRRRRSDASRSVETWTASPAPGGRGAKPASSDWAEEEEGAGTVLPATPEPAPEAPQPAPVPAEAPAEPGSEAASPFRFFSPSSIWNESPPAGAPLDPDSAAMVAALDALRSAESQAGTGPSINTTEYSVTLYTVPADQATVPVQLTARYAVPALRQAWEAVPLPANAIPAAGNDRHLVVWQPSTDRLWEFWHLKREDGRWGAEWGGAIAQVSANSGVYGSDAWPGATHWWGASACSLSIAGGLITLEDLERGKIEHALAMAVPNVRGGVYSEPAERTDGKSSEPFSLPEGAHLRLDPSLDLQALHLPRLTLMLAEAAQRYGIFVRDGAKNVTFYAQDPTPLGTNPYRGPGGFWEGSYPRQLLSYFPWDRLQVLQMHLHETH
jgi:hypothetical protein